MGSQAGADVYSITGRSAQDALSRDIAAQKAEVIPIWCQAFQSALNCTTLLAMHIHQVVHRTPEILLAA